MIVIGDRPSARFTLAQGDMTELDVDAIVNAANEIIIILYDRPTFETFEHEYQRQVVIT